MTEQVHGSKMTALRLSRLNERFIALLEKHYPTWREARIELNELPLSAEVWKENP